MRLLRLALQGNGETQINMEGPLSEIYAKALTAVYNKEDPNPDNPVVDQNNVSMETQAIDAIVAQKSFKKLIDNGAIYNKPEQNTTVYGVSVNNIDNNVIADVAQGAVKKPEDFVVVIDYSDTADADSHIEVVDINAIPESPAAALETIATKLGVPVFHNLGNALESILFKK